MTDLVHGAQPEFWQPPAIPTPTQASLADACRRCGTEFMVGAAFCHLCGTNRHRVGRAREWSHHLELVHKLDLQGIRKWFGLPLSSLCAFLAGSVCVLFALTTGLFEIHDHSDFEAIQLWRLQWLVASCAAFLAGILLRSRKSED